MEGRKTTKSCEDCFANLIAEGVDPEKLFEAVTTQVGKGSVITGRAALYTVCPKRARGTKKG